VDSEVNVLFTSAGRRVELLRAFRRAYRELNLDGEIVAVDVDPLAPALQEADHVYMVPRFTAHDYVPALIEICRRESIKLLFPLIDPDIPILAGHQEQLQVTGARVIVVPKDAAETTADKWLTAEFFQGLNIHTPRSWLPGQLDALAATYPLFIKPRRGSASRHTFRADNPREFNFFVDYVPDPIIQECLAGPEITNDVICGLDGTLLAVVSRQRIEVRWGEVAKGVTIYDPEIAQACAEIARGLAAIGPITVQCMMKEGKPYFTEVNARFGGGVTLGIMAGVDAPRWLLAQAAGINLEYPPLGSYQVGLHLTRYDDSFFLNRSDLDELVACRL
jgi:carbamoyl-phosphate synthase large subunit